MASSLASDGWPSLPAPAVVAADPFVTAAAQRRFSGMDDESLEADSGSSPTEARRALELHLAETDRRLDEAGKLGTALVSQRKALAAQLQELEKLQDEGEMGPELRSKLAEIERDYNDVARESARVLLPKQRVPSNETNPGSPYVPEGRGGRRSVSPSKFESQATGSPTKLSVPNRKSRNQSANRVHDIEFAAEISTSLIAQVRNLQGLLSERDEELKTVQAERTQLERESESLQQRFRTLDESEHRYKEENWNLETRLQELASQQREAADREKRLSQALVLANADKTAAQKELDEVKLSHSKLADQHAAAVKHHDIELGMAKRSMDVADGERAALQRKVEDLTTKNEELAKAFVQRGKALDRDLAGGMSDDDFETAADNMTPEHSPPPSPVKGTPRHSMLETETVKTSLHHAQRTIQSQRSLLHREKTEKLELRRIIQDLRDDLDKVRSDAAGPSSGRRARKMESKELKKPPRLLGNFRAPRHEIVADDPDWEDNPDASPRAASNVAACRAAPVSSPAGGSDRFESANEASESAFETANERATETEDFQTGNEDLSDSDTETETESLSRGFGRIKRPPSLPASLARQHSRASFHSTASTSADEDDRPELKTPTAPLSAQRGRFRLTRGPYMRSLRQTSEEPVMRSSPASHASGGTPKAGQSLYAELQDVGGSDEEESATGTPSRRSLRSVTPASLRRGTTPLPAVPRLPRVIMIDSGVMTDPVNIAAEAFEDSSARPRSMASVIETPVGLTPPARMHGDGADADSPSPLSAASRSDTDGAHLEQDIGDKLAQFPVPPSSTPLVLPPSPPVLGFSAIQTLHVEPRAEPQTPPTPPPTLRFTSLATECVEPVAELAIAPPVLSLSSIVAEELESVAEPEAPRPRLTMTPLLAQAVDPIASPAPSLMLSAICAEEVEPVTEPEPQTPTHVAAPATRAAPLFNMSSIMFEDVEPVSEPETVATSPVLKLSPIRVLQLVPVEERVPLPELPSLAFSDILAEHVRPVSEPAPAPMSPSLAFSGILAEHVLPVSERAPVPVSPSLAFSDILAEHVLPVSEPQTACPALSLSSIVTEDTLPIAIPPLTPPALALSSISSEHVEPLSPLLPELPASPSLGFSTIEAIETRPVSPRSLRRDGFILPRDNSSRLDEASRAGTHPDSKLLGLAQGLRRRDSPTPTIAEDDTRQSPRTSPLAHTPESQRPFREISSNSNVRAPRKHGGVTSDQGAQTALTSGAIDKLLESRPQHVRVHAHHASISSVGTPDTTGTVRIHRSQDSLESMVHGVAADGSAFEATVPFRPSSVTSGRGSMNQDVPPLPPNHRQMIDAARTSSARSNTSIMGPPLWPASATRHPPRTPSQHRPASATPRAARGNSGYGTAELHSPTKLSARSRQSSVSSFASELDSRFNMRPGGDVAMDPVGLSPNTDPRMIQAITQTMIGEFLWKYTRKTGRGEMSEKRHRRYFWVHPYTRTLYWCNQDPSMAGRSELKAKSVPIEAVRVVSDDNPMPPGLHRKSLIIISPGRTIKFTCTTGQRHETWFNALSYLLLRTARDSHSDVEEVAGNMTREDIEEFNPKAERRATIGTQAGVAPPSLSSYHSRTTRNEAAADGMSMDIPTLTPAKYRQSTGTRMSTGRLSKLSGYWKAGAPKLSGTFSGLRGRGGPSQSTGVYEASEVHDSAEDLRAILERQDRDADRLENVRACCDGKHDVGTLPHTTRRGFSQLSHSHPGRPSSTGLVASSPSRT